MSEFLWSNQVKPGSGLKNAFVLYLISEIQFGLKSRLHYYNDYSWCDVGVNFYQLKRVCQNNNSQHQHLRSTLKLSTISTSRMNTWL
jgi:hypothetical protein